MEWLIFTGTPDKQTQTPAPFSPNVTQKSSDTDMRQQDEVRETHLSKVIKKIRFSTQVHLQEVTPKERRVSTEVSLKRAKLHRAGGGWIKERERKRPQQRPRVA